MADRADPSFRQFSAQPLYNVRAVSEATGLPAMTLRSWERRYGVPNPDRDDRGFRLYSERDMARLRWLKEQIGRGVVISQAVRALRQAEEADVEPRETASGVHHLQGGLLDAIMGVDERGVIDIIGEALTLASVEDVSLHLIQPVLYQVGELWASGALSVTTERFASNVIRGQLAQLMQIAASPGHLDTMLVGCAPGELHDVGALMVALFFRRAGFRVLFAGANLEPESLLADVMALEPAAVCLSATTRAAAEALAALYKELGRHYNGVLAFGGLIFQQEPDLIVGFPGMYLGENAQQAVARLHATLHG